MRRIFTYVLATFIILVVLTLVLVSKSNNKNPQDEKLSILNNIDKKIDYFNYDYIDRYISYKDKNPFLSDEDVVTRVNLNLDYSFYKKTSISNHLNKVTILVNKYISLPSDYVPDNLESIDSKYTESSKLLVSDARLAFESMASDAKKEGYNIRVVSAYRSYNYQETLYNKYVLSDGKEKADTYSARPGYSEHQTGLVIDIDNTIVDYNNFESTKEFKWMQENSYKYGYILRYPKDKEDITGYSYESWHYRYVGVNIAKYIHDNNITFDEYYVRFIDK